MILSILKIFWAIIRFVPASYRFGLNEQVIICLPKGNCFSLGNRLLFDGIRPDFDQLPKMNFPDVSDMLARYKARAVCEKLDTHGHYMAPITYSQMQVLEQAGGGQPHGLLFLLHNTFQVLLSVLMCLKTTVFSFQTVVIFSYLGIIK